MNVHIILNIDKCTRNEIVMVTWLQAGIKRDKNTLDATTNKINSLLAKVKL